MTHTPGPWNLNGDARLTAAAPDMLDVLAQWQWAETNGDEEELKNARISRDLAIAKAKGE